MSLTEVHESPFVFMMRPVILAKTLLHIFHHDTSEQKEQKLQQVTYSIKILQFNSMAENEGTISGKTD